MKNMRSADIMDWTRIKSEFVVLRSLLEEMPGPISEQELQIHRVNTKLNLPSTLKTQLAFDYRTHHGSEATRERLSALKSDIDHGGAEHQSAFVENAESCFAIIERSIELKECSTEFVLAWGYLNQLFGRYVELIQQADGEQHDFERNEKAGAPADTIVQQYWHAHWVVTNSKTDRKAAESELAELCADIWQGRLEAPRGYDAKWFRTLIRGELGGDIPQRGNSDDAVLKTTYARAKKGDLDAMVKNPGVKPEILPPLRRDDFRTP